MAENITLAKPLKLATPGTAPIDGLTVATVKDIANIESPWNGMMVYCAADGKSYRVTKLKDVSTGVFTKKAVDTYEAVPDAKDMAAKADKTALDGKADATSLAGKADKNHTHAIADVTGLDTALAGKADKEHTHEQYALKTEIPDGVNLEPYLTKEEMAAAKAEMEAKEQELRTEVEAKADKTALAAKAEELRAEIAAKDSAQNTTTEFQVYATNAVIAAGVTDSETGIPWATDVPAGMTQKFKIRCDVLAADSDVVVEWGDGTTSAIAKNEFESSDDSDSRRNGLRHGAHLRRARTVSRHHSRQAVLGVPAGRGVQHHQPHFRSRLSDGWMASESFRGVPMVAENSEGRVSDGA